jgi:hypothetical protein
MVSAMTGVISTVAGAGFTGGNVQTFGGDGGTATAAGLALPRGLTMDTAGNLYIADSANHRIRRISTAGVMTTIAGQGTETFAGDGAPAVAASLDTPRAVAISPGGLITLADTGNQRLRQIDALPAPGPDIHTIGGVGTTAPGVLVLSGPSVVTYGSGTLTAALTATTVATGSVTFLDAGTGTPVTLGSVNLAADSASFNTSALAAGPHNIVAVYPGDATHAAAQSSALALTVTPLNITVAANNTSILYGQAVPVLSGMAAGVLPQDAGKVSAVFTTTAAVLSPVGLYPISAVLTGSAAGNYVVALTSGSLTIAQAPTLTVLSVSTSSPSVGLPVTLTAQAASTTRGVPTGSITLLDGTTVLAAVPLSATGSATFTTSAFALGVHSLSASYSGDTNFLPCTSATANLTVGTASDFTLTAAGGTSQSVPAGSAATFNFSVAMQGVALASPITLAVQGIPPGATASLNPSSLPPGGTVTAFTLTIQTPFARLDQPSQPFAPGSGLLAIVLLPAIGLARKRLRRNSHRAAMLTTLGIAFGFLLVTFATGCGDRINTASESVNAKTYTLTVTGTATSPGGSALQHSAVVTLSVL